MKPLRPHNYYGGTTCPGRVTGQVDTIRSLIPEEDEMSKLYIVKGSAATRYLTNGIEKWALTSATLEAEVRERFDVEPVRQVSDDLLNRIRDAHGPAASTGGGLFSDDDLGRIATMLRNEIDQTRLSRR